MDNLDNRVLNHIIQITDYHREGPWNNLSDGQKNQVLQKWEGFTLDRQIEGNDYYFGIDQLNRVDDLGVIGRQPAVELPLLEAQEGMRQQLDRAYLYLVEENEQQAQMDNQGGEDDYMDNQGGEDDYMDIEGEDDGGDDGDYIEGGGKTKKRKYKRRKSKNRKSKKRKSKHRKSKRRKSKTRRKRR